MVKKVWAPWRLSYILGESKDKALGPKRPACVFCHAQKGSPNLENLVLFHGKYSFVIMNKYPYANGHLMVVPKRHLADYSRLEAKEHAEMGALLAKSVKILKKVFKAEGFNIGMNLGEVGGAGIKDHLHYHIVPRWVGDHNFMPVLADVRVMPEHLEDSCNKLIKFFQKLKR